MTDKFKALKRGNTALIEALMDMCLQHCSDMNGDFCEHFFLSANEEALELLERAGFAESDGAGKYTLLYDKIDERKKKEVEK